VSCGSGVQTKTRYCLSSAGDGCADPPQETKECLPPPCPGRINTGDIEQLVASCPYSIMSIVISSFV
jgi:hypothetical protein